MFYKQNINLIITLTFFLFLTPLRGFPDQMAQIKILSLNIWHNQNQWQKRLDYITDQIKRLDIDIICLQEVLERKPDIQNQAQYIANQLGYEYYFASVDAPNKVKRFGNAILSKHPILANSWIALRPINDYRIAAMIKIKYKHIPITIINTHLHYGYEGQQIRIQQIQHLMDFISQSTEDSIIFLCGDMNSGPQSDELQTLKKQFTDPLSNSKAISWSEENPNVHHFHNNFKKIDYILHQDINHLILDTKSQIVFNQPFQDNLWPSDHFAIYSIYQLSLL